MKFSTALALILCGLTGAGAASVSNEVPSAARPVVGEMRMIAIAPGSRTVAVELHRDGWLEARGQLLPTESFPELFKVIGRAWTSDTAAENRFAVPEVLDRLQRRDWPQNPFGVLGPGDLLTSGRAARSRPFVPLTCWIFVGRPVTAVSAFGAVDR
jgi:hypothetical protein